MSAFLWETPIHCLGLHTKMPANTAIADISDFCPAKKPANTAIADISDFCPAKKPENTAIADFADISDFWATIGGICRHMPSMVAQKSEMSAKSAIAVFPGFLAGQKSEMSAIAVFAGILVWWTQEAEEIYVGMPTYAGHGCPEVGNVGKVGNSDVFWLLGGTEVGNVGNNGVCRHPGVVDTGNGRNIGVSPQERRHAHICHPWLPRSRKCRQSRQ